ncbi:MAG: hypothetical protein ACI4Q8_03860 [Ruminococcus sp.]
MFFKFINRHKIISTIALVFVIVFTVYFTYSAYVSFSCYNVIDKAMNDVDYDESFSGIISEDNYEQLNYRDANLEENLNVKREIFHSVPFILPPCPKTMYIYSYIVKDEALPDDDPSNIIYGSSCVHVTLSIDYTVFPFKIVDVYEAP